MLYALLLLNKPWTVRFLVLSATALIIVGGSILRANLMQTTFNVTEIRSNLAAMAEILTTILAISVSLILLSFQLISEKYTPRALKTVFRDSVFLGYLVTYTLAIFLLEAVLTFNIVCLRLFAGYAYLVVIFCIIYLLVLLFHMPRYVDPVHLLMNLRKRIPTDFCDTLAKQDWKKPISLRADDPVVGLEQTLLKTVTENDFPSFAAGIQLLEEIPMRFLNSIAKEKGQIIGEKPSPVFRYFLRIYSALLSESASVRREWHLTHVCESLRRLMVKLHEIKAFRAFEWSSDLFERAGRDGITSALVMFLDYFAYQGLPNLTEAQMKILDEPVHPFEDMVDFSKLSEEDRHLRSSRDILYDDFRKRLQFVSDFAQEAARTKMTKLTSACMAIFGDVLDRTLSLKAVARKRGVLKTLVMNQIVATHKKCVDYGASETTFTTAMLDLIIMRMDPTELQEFGKYVVSAYAEMGRYSIEKGFYEEVYNWGVNARSFIEKLPDFASIAIDVIVGALRHLKGNDDDEPRAWYKMARRDLEGLKEDKYYGHQSIADVVEQALVEYPPIENA
jgi:hypothetical protein